MVLVWVWDLNFGCRISSPLRFMLFLGLTSSLFQNRFYSNWILFLNLQSFSPRLRSTQPNEFLIFGIIKKYFDCVIYFLLPLIVNSPPEKIKNHFRCPNLLKRQKALIRHFSQPNNFFFQEIMDICLDLNF